MTFAARSPFFAMKPPGAPPPGDGPTTWTFSVSSTYSGYTGNTQAALSDGLWASTSTVLGTNAVAGVQYIRADFGSEKLLSKVFIAPIPSSFEGWGATYTNGRTLAYSTDGTTWTTIATTSGHADNVLKEYDLTTILGAPVTARYVQISLPSQYTGVGDFWFQ